MPQNKNHLVGRSALSADSSNYTEAKQHLMSSKAGTKSGAVQSSINLGLNQCFYLMHRGKSWDETQRTPSTASPQLCASFWALPKDLWNWVEKALLDMSISLWTLPPSHGAAQLSQEEQQRSLSHWNLASFLGSISELLTFGMGQHYLDANKCISLVWRGVPWGRSRDWAEIRWRAQGKHFRRCLAMGWASVLWLPKQGPLEAFSFWVDKTKFPSLDVSSGISAEEMVVGGSWNESLDRQRAGAASPVLNPELFTITKVSPSRKLCQVQRAG